MNASSLYSLEVFFIRPLSARCPTASIYRPGNSGSRGRGNLEWFARMDDGDDVLEGGPGHAVESFECSGFQVLGLFESVCGSSQDV
jgi:hypothetical protein